ncbi:MAG TPA: PEGA domain-containing protein [Terriglobia bacterium]|nr:PEGA domain-containing protein [Terriglobia bacterium]
MRIRCIYAGLLQSVLILSVSVLPVPVNMLGKGTALANASPNPVLRLEDGTPVKLRITRTISSANAQVGDRVDFEVLEDISVNSIVVIPKGSIAWGTVTQAQRKRRMGRGGKLNVTIDSVRLADGEKAALRAVKDTKGGGHVGAMTGAIVATSIVFFPAAPLFLFMHGKDITIPKGTEISAYVNGDMNLNPSKFGPTSTTGTTTAALPQTCAVTVTSVPNGSDITVDGNYSGSTPSTLKLSAGNHVIEVAKAGFSPWKRTISVSAGGDVTVDATLQKSQ